MKIFIYKRLLVALFFLSSSTFYGNTKNLCPISVEDIIAYSKIDKYYCGREEYLGKVIEIINDLIIGKKLPFNSVLELGPYKLPLVKGADIMDKYNWLPEVKYKHDATNVPWPIKDQKYDLFIALQVWEHLGTSQKKAFKEVMRVSKMAILSFPYKLKCKDKKHSGIDDKIIAEWTLGVKPVLTEIAFRRAIYFFIFDKQVKIKNN